MSRMTKLERAIIDALEAGHEMTGDLCHVVVIGHAGVYRVELHHGAQPSGEAFARGDTSELTDAAETLVDELGCVEAIRKAEASGEQRGQAVARLLGVPASSVVSVDAPARGEA